MVFGLRFGSVILYLWILIRIPTQWPYSTGFIQITTLTSYFVFEKNPKRLKRKPHKLTHCHYLEFYITFLSLVSPDVVLLEYSLILCNLTPQKTASTCMVPFRRSSFFFLFSSSPLYFLRLHTPYPCLRLFSLCIAPACTSHTHTERKSQSTAPSGQKFWKSHKVKGNPTSRSASGLKCLQLSALKHGVT